MPTYCPACGVPIAPGTQSCANCGASVHPTGRYPVVTPPEPDRRHYGWVVAVVAVLLVALGGGAAVALRDDGGDDDAQEEAAIDAELDALDQRFSTTTSLALGDGADSSGTASVAGQAPDPSCEDLLAAGLSYADVVDRWEQGGRDAALDEDGDGVPCESVYGEDVAAEHWSTAS